MWLSPAFGWNAALAVASVILALTVFASYSHHDLVCASTSEGFTMKIKAVVTTGLNGPGSSNFRIELQWPEAPECYELHAADSIQQTCFRRLGGYCLAMNRRV
jgi:hypothetical protein